MCELCHADPLDKSTLDGHHTWCPCLSDGNSQIWDLGYSAGYAGKECPDPHPACMAGYDQGERKRRQERK